MCMCRIEYLYTNIYIYIHIHGVVHVYPCISCIYHANPTALLRSLGGLRSGLAAAATGGAGEGDHEELGGRAAADRRTRAAG